jgi:hypothetical protein
MLQNCVDYMFGRYIWLKKALTQMFALHAEGLRPSSISVCTSQRRNLPGSNLAKRLRRRSVSAACRKLCLTSLVCLDLKRTAIVVVLGYLFSSAVGHLFVKLWMSTYVCVPCAMDTLCTWYAFGRVRNGCAMSLAL